MPRTSPKPSKAPPAALAIVEVMPKESQLLDVGQAFSAARAYATELHAIGRRVNHLSILLGAELNRLKKELGIGRGGDRKSKPQNAGLVWEDILKEQTGLSSDTCDRLMKLAEAGRKFIPILSAQDVIDTPFHQLPQARQDEVRKAIAKVSDGGTMQQLMLDFGVVAQKKVNLPPKGGKSAKNAFKGGSANRGEENEADMAAAMQTLAKDEHLNGEAGIIAMRDGNAWTYLEDADLAALDNALDVWRASIKGLLSSREEAALRAKTKKGK